MSHMADKASQTFKNHTRFDPIFHFFLAPASLVLLIWSITHMVRHFSYEAIAWVVGCLLLFLTIFLTRTYALKVQDRVIRLEERLRLASLAPGAPWAQLTERQLVALRFASDAECPALAEKAVTGNLAPKQIKEGIQSWRPDYWRV
jgi:hypothetical protein